MTMFIFPSTCEKDHVTLTQPILSSRGTHFAAVDVSGVRSAALSSMRSAATVPNR
jgi:hypothetical protein